MRLSLSEATWTEVRDADTRLALLPVGSTEQHGPHAPLGTDAYHAESVAAAAAERHDAPVAVGPTIPVGIAEEHRDFDGTLWVSPEVFRRYVRETISSLAHHGLDRVVVVNGHGGNIDALREVTATVTRHDAAYAVPFTWFESVGEDSTEMGHAGPLETSLLLATHADLVADDRFEAARDGGSERWGEWCDGVNLAVDSATFTENGTVGDPTRASAEWGEDLLTRAATALVAVLEAVEARDLGTPAHR